MFKCCIVGFGPMGIRHADAVFGSTEFRLTHIVDKNQDITATAAKYGAEFKTDFDSVDLSCVDIVIICTNGPSHAALLSKSIGRVPYVLCEKPFTDCVKDALEIAALSTKSGRTRIAVNHVRRLHPWYVQLKEFLSIERSACEVSAYLPGGLAINGLHFVDIARFLFNTELLSVYCAGTPPKRANPRGAQFVDPNGFARLVFAGGRALNLSCSEDYGAPPQVTIKFNDKIWNLIETLGTAWGGITRVTEKGRKFDLEVDIPAFQPALSLVDLSRTALQNLVSTEKVFCSVDDGVATIQTFAMMKYSSDTGRIVNVKALPENELRTFFDTKWAIT